MCFDFQKITMERALSREIQKTIINQQSFSNVRMLRRIFLAESSQDIFTGGGGISNQDGTV